MSKHFFDIDCFLNQQYVTYKKYDTIIIVDSKRNKSIKGLFLVGISPRNNLRNDAYLKINFIIGSKVQFNKSRIIANALNIKIYPTKMVLLEKNKHVKF